MVAYANVEVDMPSAIQIISSFSLFYNQNCTSKCYEGGRRRRFRRMMDLMGQTAEADEGVGAD